MLLSHITAVNHIFLKQNSYKDLWDLHVMCIQGLSENPLKAVTSIHSHVCYFMPKEKL